MNILTGLCLRRAKTFYDHIIEIPKNSRVTLFEQEIQIIKMNWPTYSDEENRQKISGYLDLVLKDLNKWKQDGKRDDEIDSKMEEMLRTRNLIQVIAPIEDCQVSVFKPRKESLIRQTRNDRSPWDEVSNLSALQRTRMRISCIAFQWYIACNLGVLTEKRSCKRRK